MANEPINDITTAQTLKQIQAQLAVLETSYANMTRTYYDMFYNKTPMDITLKIYNDDGVLETITVPNVAKASTSVITYAGSPLGVLAYSVGTICLDTVNGDMYYQTKANDPSGWVKLLKDALTYQTILNEFNQYGAGNNIEQLNANHIDSGVLRVECGGTGIGGTAATQLNGILKMIPAQRVDGVDVLAHIEVAEAGRDYLATSTLAGMIVFFPVDYVPAGYLVCNGDTYNKETYAELWNVLSKEGLVIPEWSVVNGNDEEFAVPDLHNLYIRCTVGSTKETDVVRDPMTIQEDGVPNFKGTWSMEITGGDQNISGVISVEKDDDGNYKQVDGKSTAPSGSYDYLINFNPKDYNETCARVYQDDLEEVNVRNIALVPAIKY